ncbi:MAG: TetR/AcrR family transcriptional regulator [Gemmatimonadota bacterium]
MMAKHTKERILTVAAQLFEEQGYHATGVATILRAAGVKSGSLYHFFSSKEDLLAAVMQRHLDQLRPMILDRAVQDSVTEDPLEHVFSLLGVYRRGLLISGSTRGCPVGNLALEVGGAMPRVRKLIEEYFSVWVSQVRDWLEAAGDRLPASLDRTALARHVLAVAQGGLMQSRAAESIELFDASVGSLRSSVELLVARSRYEAGELRDVLVAEPLTSDESGAPGEDQFEWRAW